jgi:hypothetical protein
MTFKTIMVKKWMFLQLNLSANDKCKSIFSQVEAQSFMAETDEADFSPRVGVAPRRRNRPRPSVSHSDASPAIFPTQPKVRLRKYFPENWLFETIELGENKKVFKR